MFQRPMSWRHSTVIDTILTCCRQSFIRCHLFHATLYWWDYVIQNDRRCVLMFKISKFLSAMKKGFNGCVPMFSSPYVPQSLCTPISMLHGPDVSRPWVPQKHDDVIKWKKFPRYWPFARGIHRWPVNSPHKGQWRGTLMFPLICSWINAWVNNCEAGDLRHHRAHYDVIIMNIPSPYVPPSHSSPEMF